MPDQTPTAPYDAGDAPTGVTYRRVPTFSERVAADARPDVAERIRTLRQTAVEAADLAEQLEAERDRYRAELEAERANVQMLVSANWDIHANRDTALIEAGTLANTVTTIAAQLDAIAIGVRTWSGGSLPGQLEHLAAELRTAAASLGSSAPRAQVAPATPTLTTGGTVQRPVNQNCARIGCVHPIHAPATGATVQAENQPRCPAHGEAACPTCSQNVGGTCDQCEHYGETGMHWDTCPNRIRGLVTSPYMRATGGTVRAEGIALLGEGAGCLGAGDQRSRTDA